MKEVTVNDLSVDKATLTLMLITKAVNDLNAEIMNGQDDDHIKIARVIANNKMLAELK